VKLLIIIYAGRWLSQMKPDAICIFIGPSISRVSPICSALFFKLIFKNNKFLYLYYRMLQTLLTRTSEMSLFNFKFSYGNLEGNPQTLPQIRIDDVEAEGCLNVTAIICPNLRASLYIICRLGICVRSKYMYTCILILVLTTNALLGFLILRIL
jgi:hypothetical protein